MKKSASAHWSGGIKDGQGAISTQTGVLRDAPYGFKSRFEDGPGTNPEELIAAAHAGCFTMALAFQLQGAGFTPDELETEAAISLTQDGSGFTITRSALTLKAKIPGIDKAKFDELTGNAEKGCPVSKLLKAEITLDATLL